MNKWKRFLALGLVTVMTTALMPTSAWAAAAKVIVEPTYVYGQVYNFDANNTAVVSDSEWKPMTVTASDTGLTASPATAGVSLYVYYDEATGKYGYKDSDTDKVVIAPAYDDYSTYSADASTPLILVSKDGKWGAINASGKSVLPFQYDNIFASYDAEGYYEIRSGESWGVMNSAGTVVIPMVYDTILYSDKLAGGTQVYWAAQGENTVLVSAVTGQVLGTVPSGWSTLGSSFNGTNLCPFYDEASGKYGYMNETCGTAIPAIFDSADDFVGSLAYVGRDMEVESGVGGRDFAVINDQGVLLTDYVYDPGWGVYGGDGLISVRDRESDLYGYIDGTGTLVIPCQYDIIDDFVNGIATVGKYVEGAGFHYGMIDTAGNIVLPLEYSNVGATWEDYDGVSDYVWIAKQVEYDDYYGLAKIDRAASAAPAPEVVPAAPTATPTSYPVILNGQQVAFDVYAMKDANGNDTNYFKLRDVAFKLNGTPAQFNVGWDGSVTITTGVAYEANGSEMSAPFTGPQAVSDVKTTTLVNGIETALDTITLTDATGSGYTYYKLRDLGAACGFVVDWDAAAGAIVINTKA